LVLVVQAVLVVVAQVLMVDPLL
jgi:hypothetical protein